MRGWVNWGDEGGSDKGLSCRFVVVGPEHKAGGEKFFDIAADILGEFPTSSDEGHSVSRAWWTVYC